MELAKELAKGYWDHRTDDETERDKNVNVTSSDYQEWVMKILFELLVLK